MTAVPLSFIPLIILCSRAHFPADNCRPGFQPVTRALWRTSKVLFPFIADCLYSIIQPRTLSSGKQAPSIPICTLCIRVKFGFSGKK